MRRARKARKRVRREPAPFCFIIRAHAKHAIRSPLVRDACITALLAETSLSDSLPHQNAPPPSSCRARSFRRAAFFFLLALPGRRTTNGATNRAIDCVRTRSERGRPATSGASRKRSIIRNCACRRVGTTIWEAAFPHHWTDSGKHSGGRLAGRSSPGARGQNSRRPGHNARPRIVFHPRLVAFRRSRNFAARR